MNNINRRNFIEKTALAGIGLAGAGAVISACKRKAGNQELGLPPVLRGAPAGKKLRAGLVGAGARGTGAAINFISSGPDLEIIGLADIFQDKIDACRERFASFNLPIPAENCFTGFDGYKKLMALPDLDVVLLVTPPKFRPDHFLEAVITGRHVFMEKPLAVDSVGIRSIITSAKKAEAVGLNVVTGTQRRHQEDYIETYRQVMNGAIGTITSAKAYWNQDHVWFREREPGWDDMEYMLRNWNNFCWLCGDHILDTHVHNIDVVNWFMGKYPERAIGYGGRHRRVTGDQYDFFSIDFDYGNGVSSHSMCRQIDSCANGTGELIMGTEGYTNCQNTKDENGNPMDQAVIPPYVQEHMHLVYAIRTRNYVNEAEQTANSTLTAIMGRTAAYTGRAVTWDEIFKSDMNLGPAKLEFGPVNMVFETPVPGTPVISTVKPAFKGQII
jgi:myo-inositol 2-dehydrogenase/D-chiro-inositol 1-dehydrogenase